MAFFRRTEELPALFARQIHFVVGKGGVGKSAVACALALHFCELGHPTLLAQVNAADSHSGLLGIDPVREDVEEAEPGLFVVNTRPRAALKEYALMTLRFEALYRAVFENRLVQQFLRFLPSLAELTMLGKLWYHAEETWDGGQRKYPRVVVDCPSTGHGLSFLRVSQVLSEVVRKGPMHEKTVEMARTFEDPSRTALHVVTLPEEMPTNETLELIAKVRDTGVAPPGALFVNAVMRELFDDSARAALEKASAAAPSAGERAKALVDVLERRSTREALAARQLARLDDAEREMPIVPLPLLFTRAFGREEVAFLAERVALISKGAA